jgi:hypothetical protein
MAGSTPKRGQIALIGLDVRQRTIGEKYKTAKHDRYDGHGRDPGPHNFSFIHFFALR